MESDEVLEISSRTWKKVGSNLVKDGYREGASDGRDESFQKGFDIGYEKGFENSEKIGIINGALRTYKILMEKKQEGASLIDSGIDFENASRGLCVMCPRGDDKKLSKETIAATATKFDSANLDSILDIQKSHFEVSLNQYREKHKSLLDLTDIGDIL